MGTIDQPLSVIREIYHANPTASCEEAHAQVVRRFQAALSDPAVLHEVPCLSPETADIINTSGLVRLRGMVADMLNPEYFVGAFRRPDGNWQTTAYCDMPPIDLDEAAEVRIWERKPLYCTPVPHESSWVAARWAGTPPHPPTPTAARRDKRARPVSTEPVCDEADVAMASAADAAGENDVCGSACDQTGSCQAARTKLPRIGEAGGGGTGGAAQEEPGQQGQQPGQQQQQQLARPTSQPGDCIVYVYGEGDEFKLHSLVEVVGLVSVAPQPAARPGAERGGAARGGGMADDGMEVDDELWHDELGAHLPNSKVLRVHALLIRQLSPRAPPPLRPPPGHPASPLPPLLALRQAALQLLAFALAGDELAAEYVLLSCLGKVFKRSGESPQGLLSLSLSNCPPMGADGCAVGRALDAALSALLPVVAFVPLTLGLINRHDWAPRKDHASGRLVRGRLQLVAGTLLLLDEGGMQAGRLEEQGVRNLQALQSVLTSQQLPCDFQFYQGNFPTDVPCVVLSQGRSMIRDCLQVRLPLQPRGPWAPAEAVATAAAGLPSLDAIRDFLGAARDLDCQLEQQVATELTQRFTALHRADPGFGTSELNIAITLAKLLSLSQGQASLTLEVWERAVAMEGARRQRLRAAAAAAGGAAGGAGGAS